MEKEIKLCRKCGVNRRTLKQTSKDGVRQLRTLCWSCFNKPFTSRRKKTFCEECGFVAKHQVQLDVDHVDGNRYNHSPDNLRTLCANCHRLKSLLSGDMFRRYEDAA